MTYAPHVRVALLLALFAAGCDAPALAALTFACDVDDDCVDARCIDGVCGGAASGIDGGRPAARDAGQDDGGAPLVDGGAPVVDGGVPVVDAGPWWDPTYARRLPLVVTTGAVAPAGGTAGYTVRAVVGPLAAVQADCDDVRVARFDGATFTELARDVVGCGGDVEVRFALPIDVPPSTAWAQAAIYVGAPGAGTPPTDGVYLHRDDGRVDRSGEYARGRFDAFPGNDFDDGLSHDDNLGAYRFDVADDATAAWRAPVVERDVLVEVEITYDDCRPTDMQVGVLARAVATGDGASQSSAHYLAGVRADLDACGGAYGVDGDVVSFSALITAVDGPDPPAIVDGETRRSALAVFGAPDATVRFWEAPSWAARGWPSPAPHAAGTTDDAPNPGDVGVIASQARGAWTNLLVRRYVEPEPDVVVGAAQTR